MSGTPQYSRPSPSPRYEEPSRIYRRVHEGGRGAGGDGQSLFAGNSLLPHVETITVHPAAALGVPTVVLRNDWFRRQWPVMTGRVPWYPNLRVVGKDGRDWGQVFDDAWIVLRGLMAGPGERF